MQVFGSNFTPASDNHTDAPLIDGFTGFYHVTWIVAVSINGALLAGTMWILFSLIHYGVKTGKWSRKFKRNADKLNAGWIYTSVVALAVVTIVRLTTSQITHNVGLEPEQDRICENVNDVLFVEYSLVLFFSYIFLWLRQRSFYTNEMLHVDYNRVLRFLSSSSIVILAVSGLGVIFVNTIPINYPSKPPAGCAYDADSEEVDSWSWALCGAVLVIGQVCLLTLLIYPLARNLGGESCVKKSCFSMEKNRKTNKGGKSDIAIEFKSPHLPRSSSSPTLQVGKPAQTIRSKRRSSATVKKIMVRTVVFGCIAIFTDIFLIAILATSLLDQGQPHLRRISVTLYDINSFLNLLLVVMSFMTYKKMLTSFCRNGAVETTRASMATSSTS